VYVHMVEEKRKIGCFPSVATNLVCVWKGQMTKEEEKEKSKEEEKDRYKYKYFITIFLCVWSMILIYDDYMWFMMITCDLWF